MPYLKTYKSGKGSAVKSVRVVGRRRGATRYKKRVNKKNTINKSMVSFGLGLPKKCLVTHKYFENIVMTSTAGAMTTQLFSTNGMFKPNFNTAGHQPMYFDQFSALYDQYHIIGARIKVTLVPTTSAEDGYQAGIYVNDDTSVTPSSITGVAEASLGKVRTITPSSVIPLVLTAGWSARKWFGPSVMANTELTGNPAANPAEEAFFTIAVQSVTAVTAVVNAAVEIEYISIWNELKEVASS